MRALFAVMAVAVMSGCAAGADTDDASEEDESAEVGVDTSKAHATGLPITTPVVLGPRLTDPGGCRTS